MSLAGELRQLRKAAGLSVPELAARAGMSESYLWELERGTRGTRATLAVLTKLATAAGQPPAVFRTYRQAVVCNDLPELVDELFYQHHPEAA